jgi:hypothetical protein
VPKPVGVNAAPIPYDGRNLLCVRRYQERIEHARLLERIAREAGGNVAAEKAEHRMSPMDLRGIPCVGPASGGGAIRGSRPEAALLAKQPRD